jgi:hypothetical protein
MATRRVRVGRTPSLDSIAARRISRYCLSSQYRFRTAVDAKGWPECANDQRPLVEIRLRTNDIGVRSPVPSCRDALENVDYRLPGLFVNAPAPKMRQNRFKWCTGCWRGGRQDLRHDELIAEDADRRKVLEVAAGQPRKGRYGGLVFSCMRARNRPMGAWARTLALTRAALPGLYRRKLLIRKGCWRGRRDSNPRPPA